MGKEQMREYDINLKIKHFNEKCHTVDIEIISNGVSIHKESRPYYHTNKSIPPHPTIEDFCEWCESAIDRLSQ